MPIVVSHLSFVKLKSKSSAVYCPLAENSIPAVEMCRSTESIVFPMFLSDWQRCPEQMSPAEKKPACSRKLRR